MKKEDGGPAFPAAFSSHQEGMSLRDYFAAAALPAILRVKDDRAANDDAAAIVARACYMIADAMLEARK